MSSAVTGGVLEPAFRDGSVPSDTDVLGQVSAEAGDLHDGVPLCRTPIACA